MYAEQIKIVGKTGILLSVDKDDMSFAMNDYSYEKRSNIDSMLRYPNSYPFFSTVIALALAGV